MGWRGVPISLSVDLLDRALSGVRVRDRRLAILGNHDSVDMPEALQRLGFETLINRSVLLTRHGDNIRVTGLDDVHSFYTPQARAALEAKTEGFRIALVHSPEMADHAAAAGYALVSLRSYPRWPDLPAGWQDRHQPARCAAVMPRRACGAKETWSVTPRQALASPAPPVRFNIRGEAASHHLRCSR